MATDPNSRARNALLYDYLLRYTAEDVPATRDALCEYLHCDRKTILREIASLREAGFDIQHKRVGHQFGYYYNRNDFQSADLQIWIDEVHSSNYLSEEDEAELTEKIEKQVAPEALEEVNKTTVSFNAQKYTDAPTLQSIAVLQDAILNNRQASFLYFDWNENHEHVYRHDKERYQVHPIALVSKNDNYYLLTWHEELESIHPFRIDRIDAAVMSLDPICDAAIAEREHVADFTKQAFNMFGGPTEEVTLQFTNDVINYIFDKFGGETEIARIDDDWCQATVEVQISPPFWGWMFQFAGKIKIIAPDEIIEQYQQRINSIKF